MHFLSTKAIVPNKKL